MQAELEDGTTVNLEVLVDTGSEVNIIRRGLISAQMFKEKCEACAIPHCQFLGEGGEGAARSGLPDAYKWN